MTARLTDPDVLLEDLTDEQRDAVTTAASPLCLIAGAGSGKTRVLTRRIAWQSATGAMDPRRVLAVTFTRRAALELRRRTRSLGLADALAAGTFHSIALAILRNHWRETNRRPPELIERRQAFLARQHPRMDRSAVADLDGEIGWARARLVAPEQYQAAATGTRRPSHALSFVAQAYANYEDEKRKRKLVDFDDLLSLCHATMTQDARFAAAQHWRQQHVLVDEFQDVNPLQFALLKSWLGPESTLLVVGDPHQAIYGWNGAEPELLNQIGQHLPGCAVLHLRTNFRSTPEILGAAARILHIDPQPAARAPGREPTVRQLDGPSEATSISRAVRACHHPGAPWRHQAVLARTNAQLPALKTALERSGIPVRSRGDGGLLRRPEILELIDGWDEGRSLSDTLTDLRTEAQPAETGLPLSEERQATVAAFLDAAQSHLELERRASVGDFLASLRSDDRVDDVADGVDLSTFHGAKGLEWPIVHLVGLEDGLVPVSFASSAAARAEERRLLYVAATRAERELHVSWCQTRMIGSTLTDRQPSPWLDAFQAPAEPLPDDRPTIASLRAQITGIPTVDLTVTDQADRDQVRDQLLRWRTEVANHADVAPTAVLSDWAVNELARQRPCRLDELADIADIGHSRARRFGLKLLEMTCLDD